MKFLLRPLHRKLREGQKWAILWLHYYPRDSCTGLKGHSLSFNWSLFRSYHLIFELCQKPLRTFREFCDCWSCRYTLVTLLKIWFLMSEWFFQVCLERLFDWLIKRGYNSIFLPNIGYFPMICRTSPILARATVIYTRSQLEAANAPKAKSAVKLQSIRRR